MTDDELFDLSPVAAANVPRNQALTAAEAAQWDLALARLLNVARVLWTVAAIVGAVMATVFCGMFLWFMLTMLVAGPGTAKGRD
jgi:hypothetical protein